MKKEMLYLFGFLHIRTLRSFITLIVSLIVAFSLIASGVLFYSNTAKLLSSHYKESIIQQLLQANYNIEDKTNLIDSIFPQIMSNSLIRDALENVAMNTDSITYSNKLELEKQLRYLMISNYLWNEKFLNAVYIVDKNNELYGVSLHNQNNFEDGKMEKLLNKDSLATSFLEIQTIEDDSRSIYFTRNIFSSYTGNRIASIIIDVNQEIWFHSYMDNINENFSIFLMTQDMNILGKAPSKKITDFLTNKLSNYRNRNLFHEAVIDGTEYFMANQQIDNKGIISVVIAPKDYLFASVYKLQKSFLVLFCAIIFITVLFSIGISRIITRPIGKMISHVKNFSKGERNTALPTGMYVEFNELADAFNQMLKQLDLYYAEIYEKQLKLKNAHIQSLQSQINPHFLFNILDTIAWKSAITGNEDVYQMIVSLGEMLRVNVLSKEQDFVTLESELKYVKFYIYLQQMRFEDKFSTELLIDPVLNNCLIPMFSIQPLVENAIIHGLEPKSGTGRLCVNVISSEDSLEVVVLDNGVGFDDSIQIDQIRSSSEDSHTHIGLKNLDKRLSLLYNDNCHLIIHSVSNQYTAISFKIPKMTEVP